MNPRLARLSQLLPLFGLAAILSGCGPIPNPPPHSGPACVGLDEASCKADATCVARYDTIRCECPCVKDAVCDCKCDTFAGCAVKPPEPPACTADSQCPAGEKCVFPPFKCPDNARCLATGTCQTVDPGCKSDQDCTPGYVCRQAPCVADAYCPPTCVKDQTFCQADSDCPEGQVCRSDSTDPCGQPGARCLMPARLTCQVACPDYMCPLLDCPNGVKVDANGCGTCESNPTGCQSDADCQPGEYCLLVDCAAGMDCVGGSKCVKTTCQTDTDCGPGSTCALPDCGGGADCGSGLGQCVKTQTGCQTDADCSPAQTCALPVVDCPADAFCAPAKGVCVDRQACKSQADCAQGQKCDWLPDVVCLAYTICPMYCF